MNRFTEDSMEYVVIKIGTETLMNDGSPNEKVMRNVAKCVAKIRERGMGVILVSSGAIGHALSTLSEDVAAQMKGKKQALSALGQPDLMEDWRRHFRKHNIRCAQGLVEDHDFETEDGRENMRRTIRELHELEVLWEAQGKKRKKKKKRALLILNGNDFVTHGPIDSDNDRIAGKVAEIIGATRVVFLTDVNGLYNGHPDDEDSRLISDVQVGHLDCQQYIREKRSENSTGGMGGKCTAAESVVRGNPDAVVHICRGRVRNAIMKALKGKIGTRFHS
jgi:glutamate 5-kinase